MPRGDGTGPSGQGGGRGMGRGRSMGQGEFCVCPQCGNKVAHERGVPCNSTLCPSCKISMVKG